MSSGTCFLASAQRTGRGWDGGLPSSPPMWPSLQPCTSGRHFAQSLCPTPLCPLPVPPSSTTQAEQGHIPVPGTETLGTRACRGTLYPLVSRASSSVPIVQEPESSLCPQGSAGKGDQGDMGSWECWRAVPWAVEAAAQPALDLGRSQHHPLSPGSTGCAASSGGGQEALSSSQP